MESFSTRTLPISKKVSYWNQISSETFARMEISPFDRSSFDGTLSREQMGPLSVVDVQSAAVRIDHTRAHIASEPQPSYLLLTPLRQRFKLSTPGAPTRSVGTSEVCLLDHARPYTLVHGDDVRVLCVDIPRTRLEDRLVGAQRMVGRVLGPEAAPTRMLLALLKELGNEVSSNSRLPAALGLRVLEFIATAYAADAPNDHPRGAIALADVIRAFIDSRLADPDLAPSEVANEFGVSTRHLRSVLQQRGESFSRYLLRRRLERSAGLLRDSAAKNMTITQIAFQSGFSNLTHFGHAFRVRYAQTPREYRMLQCAF